MDYVPNSSASITGKANLSGAANYWSMVITLRPYLFQVYNQFKGLSYNSKEIVLVRSCNLPALSKVSLVQASGTGQQGRSELDEEHFPVAACGVDG